MLDDLVTPALRAAVAVGTRFGLPVAEPEIVSTKANMLVRLDSVLARVPATTRLTRPDAADWLARDVRLARLSAKCGAPVIGPSTDPPAGPHLAEG